MAIQPLTFAPTTPQPVKPGSLSIASSNGAVGGIRPITTIQPLTGSSAPQSKPTTPSQPISKPVSQEPSIFQNIENVGNSLLQDIKGIFTPQNGKAQPITPPKQAQSAELSTSQQQAVAKLKPGEKIPGYTSAQAPAGNVLDQLFQSSAQFITSQLDQHPAVKKLTQEVGQFTHTQLENFSKGEISLEKNVPAYGSVQAGVRDTIASFMANFDPKGAKKLTSFSQPQQNNIVTNVLKFIGQQVPYIPVAILTEGLLNPITSKAAGLVPEGTSITTSLVSKMVQEAIKFAPVGGVLAALPATKTPQGKVANIALGTAIGGLTGAAGEGINRGIGELVNKFGQDFADSFLADKNLIRDVITGNGTPEQIKQFNTLNETGLTSEAGRSQGGISVSTETPKTGKVWDALRTIFPEHFTPEETVSKPTTPSVPEQSLLSQGNAQNGSVEFTPKQAQSVVVGSDLENTPLGKEIIKQSIQADKMGQNIKMNLSVGAESNLKTPGGVAATKIELVTPTDNAVKSTGNNRETIPANGDSTTTLPYQNSSNQGTPEPTTQITPTEGQSRVVTQNSENSTDLQSYFREDKTGNNPVQKQNEDYLKNNLDTATKDYTDRVMKEYNTPNVISADDAKYILPGFEAKQSDNYHSTASSFSKYLYDQKLAERKGQGDNTVLFLSGGTGAGKTTALRNAEGDALQNKSIIYDTNLTGKGAVTKIDKALENGYKVQIMYVQRDPVVAFSHGVIPRVKNEGRLVSIEQHIDRHGGAFDTLEKLKAKYGDKIEVRYIDNTGGKGEAKVVPFDKVPKYNYTKEELSQKLYDELHKAVQENKVSPEEAALISRSGSNSTSSRTEPQSEHPEINPADKITDTSVTPDAFNGTEIKNDLNEFGMNKEAGFIDPGSIIEDIQKQMEKAKKNQEDSEFGRLLRLYFVGERDVRIAETNQFILSGEKLVKTPLQQDALTLMRDFKKRPDELTMLAAGTHKYYDNAVERFKKENPTATEKDIVQFSQKILDRGAKLKKMIQQAEHPTEGMIAVDKRMTDYFKSRLEEGQKLGFLDSKISPEEYINHLLTPQTEQEVEGSQPRGVGQSKNKIGRYFQFAKGRAYKDVIEAYLNGVEPKTLNAFNAMAIYGDKHATVAATKLLIKQLHDTELGKWGSRQSKFIPSDWHEIAPESRLFKNEIPFVTEKKIADLTPEQTAQWEKKVQNGMAKRVGDSFVSADVAHQSLFAPDKVVRALAPITDPDYMNKLPFFGKTRLYQAYIKGAELSLSVFHMRAMNITAMNNMGVTGLGKSKLVDMNSPVFLANERNFVKAGGTTSILGRTIEAYHSTRQPSLKPKIPTRGDLMKMVPGVKQLEGAAQYLTYHTFDVLQRKMKVTDFAIKDAGWIAKHPNASDAAHYKAQGDFAREINATYGGLQWEVLGVNKMTQQVLKFFMLAPDWTFSNLLNVKGALPSAFPGVFKGNGGEAGMHARAFWVRSIITGIVLNQLWSVLMSGKPSDDPTKAYLGTDPQGKKIYVNIGFAGSPSDMVNLLSNINQYGIVQGVLQTAAAKESPIIKSGTEAITNRNYLGQQIVPKGAGLVAGTARSAYNLATNLNPIPFVLSDYLKMVSDPTHKYIPAEFLSILLGGGTPTHTVPAGERQVLSGSRKGQLVPASPAAPKRPFWEQVTTGKTYEPKRK